VASSSASAETQVNAREARHSGPASRDWPQLRFFGGKSQPLLAGKQGAELRVPGHGEHGTGHQDVVGGLLASEQPANVFVGPPDVTDTSEAPSSWRFRECLEASTFF